MVDISKIDVSSAHTEIFRMGKAYEHFANAQAVLNVLMNKAQVAAELDRKIQEKKDEIAKLEQTATDAATAAAEAKARGIIATAIAQTDLNEKQATDRLTAIETKITDRKAELARIEASIADLKRTAKTLAG